MRVDPAVVEWLLDADPALRWQVERDLAGAPPDVWEATRARVATEGFGARLLSPLLALPRAWQVLDILIGLTMLGIAVLLAVG